jgi:hypothetical protein
VDIEKMLAAAETADQEHRCKNSQATLLNACLLAAQVNLSRQDPEFAAIVERVRRSLGPRPLLTALLLRQDRLAGAIRADVYFQKGVALLQAAREKFPAWPTTEDWIILDGPNPEVAARTVAEFKAHPFSPIVVDVAYRMNPVSATSVLEYYFKCKMLGDAKTAAECYDEAVKAGVPLPPR